MSQKIYSGYNICGKLPDVLNDYSPRKIFLVTGKESYASSGAGAFFNSLPGKFNIIRFSDLHVNPGLEDIEKGLDVFRKEKCDLVIGVGGGSVIDTAKAVSILSTQHGRPEEFIMGSARLSNREIPSVMIPTTAGSGSESTHFSVIYIGKEKYSLGSISMLPDVVLLDPAFTENLPPHITATTAMDALCHGIESFWSVNSTDESREYSRSSIKAVVSTIVKGVKIPDRETREKLLLASNMAGRAINIAKTSAAHALSYAFTSYFNIPHGHATALTLPSFIELNNNVSPINVQDSRGVEFVRKVMNDLNALLGTDSPSASKKFILNIMKEINLSTRLSEMGIGKSDTEVIIRNVNAERLKNNPVRVTDDEIRALIEAIS